MIYGFDDDKNKVEILTRLEGLSADGYVKITPENVGDTSLKNWYVVAMYYRTTHGGQSTITNVNPTYTKSDDEIDVPCSGSGGTFVGLLLQKVS